MNKKIIMAVVIAAVIVGGTGFYGGILYGQSTNTNSRAGLNRQGAGFAMGTGQRGGGEQQNAGFSGGEIIKKDSVSVTIKLNSGSSQIILFSDATKMTKSAEGSAADLTIGEMVTVTGSKNQDGSLTAQSIQIRPASPTN